MSDEAFDEHHWHDMEAKEIQEWSWDFISTIDLLAPSVPVALITWSVEYMSGINGYLAQPVDGDNVPGVVIIHEWRGLNSHIKEMAEVLAMQWYRVLAVDLYEWKVAATMDEAKSLSSALIQEQSTANLLSAESYLRQNSTKVASLGRCLGGKQSLELSMASTGLDATIVYYGRLPTETEQIQTISGPLLGIFAELDNGIPPESVNAFESTLDAIGKTDKSITIYTGVNHAFANPTGQAFAREATLDAWTKTVKFLEENLK
jgi:carboxymethylenebutenolidase